MKKFNEAVKITVKKSNRELYNFCDLAFKILKDEPLAKIININKQIYLIGNNHAMKLYIHRESRFMEEVLFESAGYYHLSKNADNSFEMTLEKSIAYETLSGRYHEFEEELVVHKIDDIIANMSSPQICQFTKTSELKVATIAATLGLWVKDDDVKYLNVLSPVEGFKYENMLVLEHCIETGPAEVTHTYFIMNFDNRVACPEIEFTEQLEMSLDDHDNESLYDEDYPDSNDIDETFEANSTADEASEEFDELVQPFQPEDISQPEEFVNNLNSYIEGPTF